MRISGIYKIQSIIKPERIYIGSAVNVNKRWSNHKRMLKNNCHDNIKIQRHSNKYGINDLVFIILEPCFTEFLTIREQFYIDTLNPYFNICKIAGSQLGCHWKLSPESCKNISEGHKGKKSYWYGKQKSIEHIQKIADSKRGKKLSPHSAETRRKISKSNKGRIISDEWRQKISISKKGQHWNLSEETKQKMRDACKNRKPISEETRKKQSESHKGKRLSDETKLKKSISMKAYFTAKKLNKEIT